MNSKRIINIGLALFINAGIITACSTNQMPGTVASNNQQSSSSINSGFISENTEPAPDRQEQSSVTADVQSSIQDDETTIQDSEIVASEQSGFNTKAKKDKDEKTNNKGGLGIGLGLRTNLVANLGRKQREQILENREKIIKAEIKLHEAKLKVLKDFKKLNNLKRKNVDVRNSDVVEVTNADGTISKIITVNFENKTETNTRENKVIKTFSADGKLIKMEHYLIVNLQNYTRTYTKIVDYNTDGSKKVIVKSETKWADGISRVVNEERNINADGSGTGSGTIVITDKNGTVKAYDIKVTISVDGNVVIGPVPSPTPSPTVSPTATTIPSASPTASPTPTPIPSEIPTPTVSPSPTASVTTSVEINTTVNVGT